MAFPDVTDPRWGGNHNVKLARRVISQDEARVLLTTGCEQPSKIESSFTSSENRKHLDEPAVDGQPQAMAFLSGAFDRPDVVRAVTEQA